MIYPLICNLLTDSLLNSQYSPRGCPHLLRDESSGQESKFFSPMHCMGFPASRDSFLPVLIKPQILALSRLLTSAG